MKYIQIVNWDKFQHYKRRDPPWIKLYNSILDKIEFQRLTNECKLLLFHLWLVASKTDNLIPLDEEYLRDETHLRIDFNFQMESLIKAEFVIVNDYDSTMIATCKQSAIVRRGEERREEKNDFFSSNKKQNVTLCKSCGKPATMMYMNEWLCPECRKVKVGW